MTTSNPWLLPDGIEELLPRDARRLEHMRQNLLKLYHGWGYEHVIPPLIEYLDALLVGTASDLESSTFRLIDSLSGRMVGVRADMTPQVARIDANRLKSDAPARLCYLGPVLLTKARELGGSRSPFQAGAELYGYAGLDADLEVLDIMLQSLRSCKLSDVYLDLGHVAVYRSLASQAQLDENLEDQLFDALQRKAAVEIDTLLGDVADRKSAEMLKSLADLNGGVEVIAEARSRLRSADKNVHDALDDLQQVCDALNETWPTVPLHVDLAELRGYRYHTGMVFSAYIPEYGQAVAHGGRYDGIGGAFGRSRPATGYSMDLRAILAVSPATLKPSRGIFAPAGSDTDLVEKIAELRRNGERVVRELRGQKGGASEVGCDRVLAREGSGWTVKALS